RLRSGQHVVVDEPHGHPAGLPAARDEPAPMPARRRCAVGVKPLRVVLAREGDYLLLAHRDRPELDHLAGMKLGELHQYVSKCSLPWARSRAARGSHASPLDEAMPLSAS